MKETILFTIAGILTIIAGLLFTPYGWGAMFIIGIVTGAIPIN